MTLRLFLTALVVLASGCRLIEPTADDPLAAEEGLSPDDDREIAPSENESGQQSPPSDAAAGAANVSHKQSAAATNRPSPQPLVELVEQLAADGALNAATKAELLDNLQQSDPATWPQLEEYLRASLARRRAARTADAITKTPNVKAAEAPLTTTARPLPAATDSSDVPAAIEPVVVRASAANSPAELQREAVEANLGEPSAAESEPVGAREEARPQAQNWRDHLGSAIAGLETELEDSEELAADESTQAALRLLYLVDGRRDEALRPATKLPAAAQDFWSKQVYGLGAYLDAERTPSAERRATEAVAHLREASEELAALANLRVRNLSLCTKVAGFGDYQRFVKYEFSPGQEVVLYAEVENFHSQSTEQGYKTALTCSVEVLDSRGERVADEKFRVAEQNRQTPRRDFFLSCNFWMPKRLAAGSYLLRLSIEDELGKKTDQSTVDVTIRAN